MSKTLTLEEIYKTANTNVFEDFQQDVLQWVADTFLCVTPNNYPTERETEELSSNDDFYEAGGQYVLDKQLEALKAAGWKLEGEK